MKNIREKIAWALAATLGLLVAAALSGVIDAGPLDPPGAPAPTGKTLEEIPGSWSRALPANDGAVGPNPPAGCNSTRFQCVLGDTAVVDRETGLVWRRDANTPEVNETWIGAVEFCRTAAFDPRRGWRLPSVEELTSLLTSVNSVGQMPAGHPFQNVQAIPYWTSTERADDPTLVFTVNVSTGTTAYALKSSSNHIWCVRGAVIDDKS